MLFPTLMRKKGYGLVSEKAEDGGHDHSAKVGHRLRMDQAGDCFIAGDKGAQRHDEHNYYTSEVFKAAQAVGEPLGGFSSCEEKREPQWERCGSIAKIMDGVSEEGHAPPKGLRLPAARRRLRAKARHDHLIAHRPRAVVTMVGSTMPCRWLWPACSSEGEAWFGW